MSLDNCETDIFTLLTPSSINESIAWQWDRHIPRFTQGISYNKCISAHFYPLDAMLARSLRQRRVRPSVCLSVSGRPSVTRRYCA